MKPLLSLTEDNTPLKLSKKCQETFEHLKKALISFPILSDSHYGQTFIAGIVSNNSGIRGVLSQMQVGK